MELKRNCSKFGIIGLFILISFLQFGILPVLGDIEPNNNSANAETIVLDQVVLGNLTMTTDTDDYYNISLTQGDGVIIRVYDMSASLLNLEFLYPNATSIDSYTSVDGSDIAIISLNVFETGVYTIHLSLFLGITSPEYALVVEDFSDDDYEENDDFSNSSVISRSDFGETLKLVYLDEDWFVIPVLVHERFYAYLPYGSSVDMTLYNENQEIICNGTELILEPIFVNYTAQTTMDVYLKINSTSVDAEAYSLTVGILKVSHLEDTFFSIENSNHLEWEITDLGGLVKDEVGSFSIYINGISVKNGTWDTLNDVAFLSLNDLELGTYDIAIEVRLDNGLTVTDTLVVEILTESEYTFLTGDDDQTENVFPWINALFIVFIVVAGLGGFFLGKKKYGVVIGPDTSVATQSDMKDNEIN